MVEATSDFISLKGITKTYGEKLAEPVYALRGMMGILSLLWDHLDVVNLH